MRIVIAGGTGFIGKTLTDLLISEGHEVIILTRKNETKIKGVTYVPWLKEGTVPEKKLENIDAFINLAGVSINNGRWSKEHQEQIYNSRMEATDELLRIISVLPQKPSTFINASAIGIYPVSLDAEYTEKTKVTPNDFLGRTVYDWENRAKQVEKYGVRCVFMRFGVVLGSEGALSLMALPYRMFAGGTVGTGKQWVSWVHVLDVARAIAFSLRRGKLSGPVNVTAPTPLRMKDFGNTIATILKRPHWLPVPAIALKLVLGQKSKLVLEGQKVLPKVLIEEGFEFTYPSLDLALKDLFRKS
ncbi:TIGR01777 family oxidoreductase [Ureibacillus manganicus]|uniref:Multidrug MFS transporter n=1 Tax=Ureibacillus manganicus DSM 26584 TaxID=1384049 RepID=A0A0A3IRT2_9BACL|nr:TIGR01777 family oxidoreductase [Ureibacillus manganicus]KGR77542.1 multidrug MFS transporter [Ureibacillus manganicus DSM 26584]